MLPRRIRFGAFELDVHSGELRKGSTRLRVPAQSIEILNALVEQPGELVTREHLRQRLWPSNTFVDFEAGLNAAVRRLRDALGDAADTPRFIETLPRRGYRFIGVIEPGEQMSGTDTPAPQLLASYGAVVPAEEALPPRPVQTRARSGRTRRLGLGMLLVMAAVGATWWTATRAISQWVTRSEVKHDGVAIAVLPFADLSPDGDQAYFADGLADELIDALAHLSGVRVAARTSSFSFKGKNLPVPEIARALNVQYVVEGSVRKSNQRLRITMKVVEGTSGYQQWQDTYDRELGDVFRVQEEIARAVARAIALQPPGDTSLLVGTGTRDLEAYDLYLRGRFAWGKRTETGIYQSIDFFKQAIARDANHARAYAGIADAHIILGNFSWRAPGDAYPPAKVAASEALRLDPDLAEAHTSLAGVHLWYDQQPSLAEREFRRALDLNPNSAFAHYWYAVLLTNVGRHSEAIARAEHARELDPLAPQIAVGYSRVLYLARKYDRAIDEARKAIAADAGFANGHSKLGLCYIAQGRFEEGIAALRRGRELYGGGTAPTLWLAWGYARAGRGVEARALLSRVLRGEERGYIEPDYVAQVLAALGDREGALAWVERAVTERAPYVTEMGVEPALDPLRSDRRFTEILQRTAFTVQK